MIDYELSRIESKIQAILASARRPAVADFVVYGDDGVVVIFPCLIPTTGASGRPIRTRSGSPSDARGLKSSAMRL